MGGSGTACRHCRRSRAGFCHPKPHPQLFTMRKRESNTSRAVTASPRHAAWGRLNSVGEAQAPWRGGKPFGAGDAVAVLAALCPLAGAKAGATSQPKRPGPRVPDEQKRLKATAWSPGAAASISAAGSCQTTLHHGAVIYANDLLLHIGDHLQRWLEALRQHSAPCQGSLLSRLCRFLSARCNRARGQAGRFSAPRCHRIGAGDPAAASRRGCWRAPGNASPR